MRQCELSSRYVKVTLTLWAVKGNLIDEPIVARSALKHGVVEADALHAFRNAIARTSLDEGVDMFVGADRSGQLLEVGVVSRNGARLIIHAMRARTTFLPKGE